MHSPLLAALCLAALTAPVCLAKELPAMTFPLHANGPFEVKVSPEPLSRHGELAGLGRLSLDKRFHGDLEAESHGEMLAYGDPKSGSAGYVAIEKVTGRLQGREGSFALQHSSTLEGGVPHQSIRVVPASGTGELEGIQGEVVIDIAPGGAHSYRFDYTLPAR
jgi:hypothetical protein